MKNIGFTIIELGVVIVLIGLITLLLFPLVKMVRKEAYRIDCVNNLQKISLALREYALENEEKLPSDLSLIFTQGYLDSEDIFDCRFSSNSGDAKNPDYVYIKTYDFKSSKNLPIVYDKKVHKDGTIYVLYLNGEVLKRTGAMAE